MNTDSFASVVEEKNMPGTSLREKIISYFSLGSILWVMIWLSLNTGPWVFDSDPAGYLERLHYIRATFPAVCLFIALIALLPKKGRLASVSGPPRFWLFYGMIGLVSSLTMAPDPFQASYWAISYLSACVVLKLHYSRTNTLASLSRLNRLSWLTTSVLLIILVIFAREHLFVGHGLQLSGYGIEARMSEMGGMPMSRSSGLSRFAAVPGIIAFILFWYAQGWKKIFWGLILVLCGILIYAMQSRGSIIAFLFAISFVMIFLSRKTRFWGVLISLATGILLINEILPNEWLEQISSHLKRVDDLDNLYTFSGRTLAWERAWPEIFKSPWLGWGFQADRYLLGLNIHNTYLYALLTAGFTGAAFFVIGLVKAWIIFFKSLFSGFAESIGQRKTIIQIGGIMAFFTVRSIVEVSGSLVAIDFLVMLPAIAFLGALNKEYKAAPN